MPSVLTPAQPAEFDEKGFTCILDRRDGDDEHFTGKQPVPDVGKAVA